MSMRTPLTIISLILSVGIGLALARKSEPEKSVEQGRVRIGFSFGTLQEERWQRDRAHFEKRATELGAEVLVQAGNTDGTRQLQDVEALLSRDIDVLVIVAFNPVAMSKGVESAKAAGVPVICYDRMISDADVDLYLSFDNVRVGRMQAQYVVDRLQGKGKIVRIYGPSTDQTGLLFKKGQDEVLKPYLDSGAIQVIHEDYAADWKPENAKKIMNAAITAKGTEFQAVIATNDGTAGGAIQALIEDGLAGKVLVTGQDADLAACQRIVGGVQSMSVYKPLHRLATTAAEAAFALGARRPLIARESVPNGRKEVPSILEEIVAVDRENLKETVIKDGFHKAEDLKLEN